MLFRRVRITPEARSALAQAYRVATNRKCPAPLAAARSLTGWCVLLPDVLAEEDTGQWRLAGWHTIEQGGWNDQNRELRWEETSGRRGSIIMDDPQRVPEVFRERVQASIVVQKHIQIEGTREGGVVSARRDLAHPDQPLSWRTWRGRGTPDDDHTRAILEAAMAELKADFDI